MERDYLIFNVEIDLKAQCLDGKYNFCEWHICISKNLECLQLVKKIFAKLNKEFKLDI